MQPLDLIASSVTSVTGWEQVGQFFLGTPLTIVGIMVGTVVLRWLIYHAIDRLVATTTAHPRVEREQGPAGQAGKTGPARRRARAAVAEATRNARQRQRQRMVTLASVLKSVTTLVLGALAVLTIMAELGVPLAPLVASAGVGGVAIGFGAQSLVKDFLSGIFMIVEDQYGVGDVIDTGDVLGTVEEVSLRVTRVRDFTGAAWYIRNGQILRVANHSQGWSTAVVDVPVAASEDADRVVEVIGASVSGMHEDGRFAGRLLETPQVLGVQSVTPGVLTIRVMAQCGPVENYGIQREIWALVKSDLDRAGIRRPPIVPVATPAPA